MSCSPGRHPTTAADGGDDSCGPPPARTGTPPSRRPHVDLRRNQPMSVAKVTELSCTSTESFEDAIRQGIERASRTLRGVRSAWVKEQRVLVNGENVVEFQANI